MVILDPYRGRSKGMLDAEWKLVINVNPKNLTEWITH
jgi:predicted transcriptional regulator of viral defense system